MYVYSVIIHHKSIIMNSQTFIQTVKKTKESLRGDTLTVYGNGEHREFNTLKSFGAYILSILKEDSVCYIDGY